MVFEKYTGEPVVISFYYSREAMLFKTLTHIIPNTSFKINHKKSPLYGGLCSGSNYLLIKTEPQSSHPSRVVMTVGLASIAYVPPSARSTDD